MKAMFHRLFIEMYMHYEMIVVVSVILEIFLLKRLKVIDKSFFFLHFCSFLMYVSPLIIIIEWVLKRKPNVMYHNLI